MKVNVVVVTYNRKVLLEECLNAILNQTYKFNKIILIDNNSDDGTYEMLIEKGYLDNPLIDYNKLKKNIGGAGGFYEGLKKSFNQGADYSWIMDDDTIPEKNSLEKLVDYLKKSNDKQISYLSSYVYDLSGNVSNVPQFIEKNKNKISAATFVSLLISNNAIEKIGLPVKDYFIWGDDTEYTYRLTRYFGDAYYVKESKVLHKRVNTGGLSIIKEENKNRINFWHYNVRNNLNNYMTYFGFFKMLKQIVYYDLLIIQCIFKPNVKYRFKKIKILFSGIFAYIFKKYDYKAFKNRFDYKVKYKD